MNVRETWYRPIGSLDFHGIQWSTMVHFPRGRGGSIAANRVGGHDVRLARGGRNSQWMVNAIVRHRHSSFLIYYCESRADDRFFFLIALLVKKSANSLDGRKISQ